VVQDAQQAVSWYTKAAEQGETMYQFTALLNTSKKKEAYLSGNQNCLLSSSKAEMYQVAKSVDGLKPTAPYTKWANNLDSINDFDFHIFQDKDKEKVKLQAQSYAINNGILNIRKGRPTKL
jgi:TPR repeat protein